jgi:hypothetical protein
MNGNTTSTAFNLSASWQTWRNLYVNKRKFIGRIIVITAFPLYQGGLRVVEITGDYKVHVMGQVRKTFTA